MPQANITYDTVYNRKLVEKMRKDAKDSLVMRDEPTPFPFRLGTFHDPHQKTVMLGGGAPAQFIVNGNSPAYPPLHMRSGMEVSSGGQFAGVDGAVGGNFFKDFVKGFRKGFGNVLKVASAPLALVAPEIAAPLGAVGNLVAGRKRGRPKKGGVMSGGVSSGGVMSGGKKHAGRPKGSKNKKALTEILSSAIESSKPMKGAAMSGGKMCGGGRSERAAIVKKVMAEKGLKLIAASKYVKEHGLYKPKK